MRKTMLFLIIAFSPAYLLGQVTGAIIQGIVSDPQSAAVPNATVTATNIDTGVSVTTETNNSGLYEFPEMVPGRYTINIRAPGFAAYVHKGIELVLQQRLRVDASMQLSGVSETVNVTGTPTLLDTDNANVSHVISGDLIASLPVFGRNSYMITRLVPGAELTLQADPRWQPFDTYGPSDVSFNGTPAVGNTILINGISNTYANGALAFAPPTESLQEVNIQTFALSAEYGQTSGAVTSMEVKSGTNSLHGAAYDYHTNRALNANNFFLNSTGTAKPALVNNQFGFNLGAPVLIPKIYNGKNRTFFFWSYEGVRDRHAFQSITTLPTQLERSGDFSQTRLADGRPITIYNPFTTHFDPANPSVLIRDPFPGNRIPPALINPVAKNILSILPLPNLPGSVNNFLNAYPRPDNANTFLARADHHFTPKSTLFFTYGQITAPRLSPDSGPNLARWTETLYTTYFKLWSGGFTHILSPTTILNVRFGSSYDREITVPHTSLQDRLALGFAPAFTNALVAPGTDFPTISGSDIASFGTGTSNSSFYTPNFRAFVTKIVGRHSISTGYEYRLYRTNIRSTSGEAGSFNFSRDWTQGPNASQASATTGHGVATMLLGTVSSGSVNVNANSAVQSIYNAIYVQDNWRIVQRLTLNLGLRWDYESPVTERFNRITRGFDPNAALAIASAAQANYSANPLPELQSLKVAGGILFPDTGGRPRTGFDPYRQRFSPRLGFAFQATPKTVVRAGYGWFYLPLQDSRGDTVSRRNPPLAQTGFAASTAMQTSLNGVPADLLTNPFPGGFVQPAGSSLGAATLLGQTIALVDPAVRPSRTQEYQFSLERELAWSSVIEIAYVGSRSDHLMVDQQIDAIPNQFLSLRDDLNRAVNNPFYGLISVGTLSRPTVTKSQLLRPFPQFTGVTLGYRPIGSNWYNSLQSSWKKRLSQGLTVLASYTYSKNMQKRGFLNTDMPLEQVIAPFDRTHRAVISGLWELPFGVGKRYGSGLSMLARQAFGNWELNWVTTLQTGTPVSGWAGAVVTRPLQAVDKSIYHWFDTAAFAPLTAFTLRTLSSNISQIRGDTTKNIDLTLAKNFHLRESMRFQVNAQVFNLFNHPQFSTPNTSVTSSAFGTITAQANYPRYVQIAARFLF